MEKLLFLISILITNLTIAQIPSDGLVAYYPFNSNGNDESGNGNNLTLIGDNYTTDRKGNSNSALTILNGFSGMAPQMLNGSDKITIAFWYYTPDIDPGNRYPIFNSNNGWRISCRAESSTEQRIRFENDGITLQPAVQNIGDALDRWIFACITYNDLTNEIGFFFDNQVYTTFTKEFNQLSASPDATIGYYYGTTGKGMDDIRIYDRILTEQEIIALYNEGGSEPQPTNSWQQNGNSIYYDGIGNVGIGTNNPAAKLTVNGPILSTEVKVKTDVSTYPDFVFKPEYKLRTLSEVERYINEHGHLPEIPKAVDVEEGVNLGEMNAKLLQKIEELTLYTIDQNKKIEQQNKQLHHQNEKMEKQNKKIQALEEKLAKLELMTEQ